MKAKSAPKSRRKKPIPAPRPATPPASAGVSFPIVGIGASAGGLEALEQFLGHIPVGRGIALVIVQHLDPTHKGIMPELLQRATNMKVIQVRDRTQIRPDRVYVIPPNKDMSILHGILHLLKPAAPRGQRLPIDFFFRSLALDLQEHSIGVLLSGMGSDGTLGLRAIKEKAGVVLVQEPATAKFDGMPRSAIDAGLADVIAPVDELPSKIISYLQRTPLAVRPEPPLPDKTQSSLEKAVILLRAHTGNDFSLYKKNTLYRRIERRMGLLLIDKIANYVHCLRENPQELELLFKELLIGVTRFFRDSAAWKQLRDRAIPALLADRASGQALRAWVPGCSTGEEAYSLAMVFKEAVEEAKPRKNIALQIFATDLDRDAIGKARQGLFPENVAADVSPERLSRFFAKEEPGYRVQNEIREMVIFAPQNLVMDPPFTKLDILSCRNLLIYLTSEVQKKLIPLFHYSLNSGGILFLGSAETIGNSRDRFVSLGGKARLFHQKETTLRPEPVEFPSSFSASSSGVSEVRQPPKPSVSLQSLADQLVLHRYAPPAVLVNDKGDIFYISGRTGKYLEPAAGRANWNVFAMAREGLRYELAGAFQKAVQHHEIVTLHQIQLGTNGGEVWVEVSVQRLDEPEELRGLVMILFTEVAAPEAAKAAVRTPKTHARNVQMAELEQELQRVRVEARTTHEEMQTSQEELRSANEELQSTNEDLQSTNEELTTSKEEMQSLNEELQTVNTELQAKVEELSRASNDMKNLLDSTDIATLFLDQDLNVRRFTAQVKQIINLIPGDVGRPITDLVSNLNHPTLAEEVRTVLRTLVSVEESVATRDGRWFTVRIMPYYTLDNQIDGVVITFADITAAKTLEAKLIGERTSLEKDLAQHARKRGKEQKARTVEEVDRREASQTSFRTGATVRRILKRPTMKRKPLPSTKSKERGSLGNHRKQSLPADELRRRAEAQLRERTDKSRAHAGDPKSVADTHRLLHELQVHQVELEMQNVELQEARDRLEALLDKYTDLYDFAPVGYFSLNEESRILEVNLTGAALLGIERSRFINQHLIRLVAPASQQVFRSFLTQVFTNPGKQVCEAELLRKDGTTFWAGFHGTCAVSLSSSPGWCRVAVSDLTAFKQAEAAQHRMKAMEVANQELRQEISQRKQVEKALKKSERDHNRLLDRSRQMQAKLRHLSHQILRAQEEERKRISRELHDDIAQTLVGINVHLETLAREVTSQPRGLKQKIARTQRLVEESVTTVHRFARELRPTSLDDLGLIATLHSFMKDFIKNTGIRVQFTTFAEVEQLNSTRRTVLYRIVQSALTNVAQHAQASRVQVSIRQHEDAVHLEVADNGKSFEVERVLKAKGNKHLGLLGMRERVEMVGGHLTIDSAPDQGTVIRAHIPFRTSAAQRKAMATSGSSN